MSVFKCLVLMTQPYMANLTTQHPEQSGGLATFVIDEKVIVKSIYVIQHTHFSNTNLIFNFSTNSFVV